MCEFNVGAQISIGGPSIGDGMLLVPTENIMEAANSGGYTLPSAFQKSN